ncbi:MAG: hypothetical protein HY304_03835 [candidate division Zixibacteria bacterium]|nr:hypothetical protein [candidate division Zixibacteria bacterium]
MQHSAHLQGVFNLSGNQYLRGDSDLRERADVRRKPNMSGHSDLRWYNDLRSNRCNMRPSVDMCGDAYLSGQPADMRRHHLRGNERDLRRGPSHVYWVIHLRVV